MRQHFLKGLIILSFGLFVILAGCNQNPADNMTPETAGFDITVAKNNAVQMLFSSKGNTVYFEVPAGYKSYTWYLDGKKLENEKSNKYSVVTDSEIPAQLASARFSFLVYEYEDGIHEVLVVVEDTNGEYHSATATFIIQNTSNPFFN